MLAGGAGTARCARLDLIRFVRTIDEFHVHLPCFAALAHGPRAGTPGRVWPSKWRARARLRVSSRFRLLGDELGETCPPQSRAARGVPGLPADRSLRPRSPWHLDLPLRVTVMLLVALTA